MTLVAGDLTTLVRLKNWMPNIGSGNDSTLSQIIGSSTNRIYNKLNRARLYSQQFTRIIDGVGNYQIVLPDYPVTGITSLQLGASLLQPSPLPTPTQSFIPPNVFGYGYRTVLWQGNMPGDPAVVEVVNGVFWRGVQNVKAVYQAGYLISSEPWTIPSAPYQVQVLQPQGIWCRDNGVMFADTGAILIPVSGTPSTGQYNPPTDPPASLAILGQYTFAAADTTRPVLISYSFIPADLEEACIQLTAETFSYRDRVGQLDKILGGQETIRYLRGGIGRGQMFGTLPPEVEDRIWPYVSVIPPAIGAPV